MTPKAFSTKGILARISSIQSSETVLLRFFIVVERKSQKKHKNH